MSNQTPTPEAPNCCCHMWRSRGWNHPHVCAEWPDHDGNHVCGCQAELAVSDQTPTVVADLGMESDGYVGIVSTVLDIDDTPCEHGCTCPPRLPLPPGRYVVVSADDTLLALHGTQGRPYWTGETTDALRLLLDGKYLRYVYPKEEI